MRKTLYRRHSFIHDRGTEKLGRHVDRITPRSAFVLWKNTASKRHFVSWKLIQNGIVICNEELCLFLISFKKVNIRKTSTLFLLIIPQIVWLDTNCWGRDVYYVQQHSYLRLRIASWFVFCNKYSRWRFCWRNGGPCKIILLTHLHKISPLYRPRVRMATKGGWWQRKSSPRKLAALYERIQTVSESAVCK